MTTTYQKRAAQVSRFPRRAFVATATTAGLCGAAVIVAPRVVPYLEDRARQAALDAAVGELQQLEGVSIDAALEAAEITRAAVQVIVLPVANLVATLGAGALGLLLGALDAAHNALAFLHASTDTVDQVREIVASWQTGLTALPIALNAYATADIKGAETYLRALKKRMAKP